MTVDVRNLSYIPVDGEPFKTENIGVGANSNFCKVEDAYPNRVDFPPTVLKVLQSSEKDDTYFIGVRKKETTELLSRDQASEHLGINKDSPLNTKAQYRNLYGPLDAEQANSLTKVAELIATGQHFKDAAELCKKKKKTKAFNKAAKGWRKEAEQKIVSLERSFT